MSDPVQMGSAPPETVLPDVPAEQHDRLAAALTAPVERRRDAVVDVVRAYPSWPEAWAALGELARDDVEAYACFRVGYHRGLDQLRQAGWRGSGYVRAGHAGNRGFLACLRGLAGAAAAIGEGDERERCDRFLRQLDPAVGGRAAPAT